VNRRVIITAAVTGNLTQPAQTPQLPITPEQIATACIDSARAGAAIAHIHVREPDTGAPSMRLDLYEEVVNRIRASGVDVLINLTTGPGGRFVPSRQDPRVADAASSILPPERRVEHITALRPDIATLDLNTMWSGSAAVINAPWSVKVMAEAIYAAGAIPELEVFDSGDIQLAHALLADGTLAGPGLFQIVLGVRYGFVATPATLAYAHSLLPADAIWAAFGIGRAEFPMLAQAWLLGGHVRVGLEDNIYLAQGVLAESNAQLVERAVRLLRELGAEPMSSAEARQALGAVGRRT
jgi:uncharacterized protein (DUF849 family)